jgi:hypothetical protein
VAVSLPAVAQAPYSSAAQIVSAAYTLVFATGMFPEACREWCRNPAEHMWVNFKTFFSEAHQDLGDSQITSRQSGSHDANSMLVDAKATGTKQQDTAKAITNLATTTASNRATVTSLSATNSKLTAELSTTTNKLSSLFHSVNAALKIELATLWASRNNDHHTTPANASRTHQANRNYCWTHGCKISGRHTSSSCLKPANVHQRDATKENRKGGSEHNKEWQSQSNQNSTNFSNSIIKSSKTVNHYSPQQHPKHSKNDTAIINSGCTGHFLWVNSPCINKVPTNHGIPVRLPNAGTTIQSTHTSLLDLPQLHLAARQAHIFPDLANSALISIGQFCDKVYKARFTQQHNMTIQHNKAIVLWTQYMAWVESLSKV